MNAICVDDEAQVLNHIVSSCQKIKLLEEVKGFTRPQDALDWLAEHPVDLALLDIDMPGMSGLELAHRIRKNYPDISVIFITAFSQYALDAYEVHPSSYLLKPFDQARLNQEVEYALSGRTSQKTAHIVVQTFGHFEILVDGKALAFRRSKSKELLAYLVDKQGSSVTRAEIFAAVWEDRRYDRPMQKQLDALIRSMRDTLREYGIERIFEMKNGTMRVDPTLFTCDAYLFFQGDADTVNAFRGEYMSAYPWASITESIMTQKQRNGN